MKSSDNITALDGGGGGSVDRSSLGAGRNETFIYTMGRYSSSRIVAISGGRLGSNSEKWPTRLIANIFDDSCAVQQVVNHG